MGLALLMLAVTAMRLVQDWKDVSIQTSICSVMVSNAHSLHNTT